jgi:type IV pilus assembly protein PilV
MKQLRPRRQAGATLIEVLVSILILMFGLLGLVGVMIQSQRAQLDAFQREQALLLAQDMVSRMTVNKAAAPCYVLATYIGADNATAPVASACAGVTTAQAARFASDMADWLAQLQGAGEKLAATSAPVGGIPTARGCITQDATSGIYLVSVAWQGSATTSAPPAGITCGLNSYGTDTARRAVALSALIS